MGTSPLKVPEGPNESTASFCTSVVVLLPEAGKHVGNAGKRRTEPALCLQYSRVHTYCRMCFLSNLHATIRAETFPSLQHVCLGGQHHWNKLCRRLFSGHWAKFIRIQMLGLSPVLSHFSFICQWRSLTQAKSNCSEEMPTVLCSSVFPSHTTVYTDYSVCLCFLQLVNTRQLITVKKKSSLWMINQCHISSWHQHNY